jgi:hypothetical protein
MVFEAASLIGSAPASLTVEKKSEVDVGVHTRSLTAALRRGARAPGNPALQSQGAVMTTLYVRDQSGFREAAATDVLDRAHALLAQRYRVGSPC